MGFVGDCEAVGVRAREIRVDYAAHSVGVEAIRGELLEGCAGIEPCGGGVPFYSTVTGGLLDMGELGAEYWYRNLRETVQFERVTRLLLGEGYRAFIEVGPHPVLTVPVQETVDVVLDEPVGRGPVVVGSLRRGEGGGERFLGALSEVWVRGVDVDWGAVFEGSGARRVGLPSYAFQRERFWVDVVGGVGDLAAAGQRSVGHPLLGAVVGVAGGGGWLFTGRLSLGGLPWLGDHVVLGSVLLPGTAFLEVALHAGSVVGAGVVRELVLEAPLVLVGDRGVQLQVAVGEQDERGSRTLNIYSRLEDLDEPDSERWTRHATGILTSDTSTPTNGAGTLTNNATATSTSESAGGQFDALSGVWPPEGAVGVDVDGFYDGLAGLGLEYGPVFQGLRGLWRRGGEVFAEVVLSGEVGGDASLFGVHPALLDGALHAVGAGLEGGVGGAPRLPFAWGDVRLFGVGARCLRVCVSFVGDGVVSLAVADEGGAPVVSVGSLVLREVSVEGLAGVGGGSHRSLFCVDWVRVDGVRGDGGGVVGGVVLVGGGGVVAGGFEGAGVDVGVYGDLVSLGVAVDGGLVVPGVVVVDAGVEGLGGVGVGSAGGVLGVVHGVARGVLGVVQGWLADERFEGSRLVVLTGGAVAVGVGDGVLGLAQSPVWGLVRSAQSEHPGRFVLVDVDGSSESWGVLSNALCLDEPQLAVRDGVVFVARVTRATGVGTGEPVADGCVAGVGRVAGGLVAGGVGGPGLGGGTVLVTGGTGVLGGVLAERLVREWGVRSLLLVSRRGRGAPGAVELEERLCGLGVRVSIAACDVSDRGQLAGLIGGVGEEFPLCGVVHAAGVLDDGVVESLTVEQVDRVLAAKADAAWYLHELTEQLDLSVFVLCSSAAGVFGGPGQGNYAAANAFLDALAGYRRARGLAGSSIAWGLWAQASALTGGLSDADLARMARSGFGALPTDEALELFDGALRAPQALTIALRLDTQPLRALARNGTLPPLLRSLIRTPTRRASGDVEGFARRLADVGVDEREGVVVEMVRGQVAGVLGHASAAAVDPEKAFKDLGFDSLAAVELRNRLSVVTGLRLPATLVFDYPTVSVLAGHLLDGVVGAQRDAGVAAVAVSVSMDEPVAIVGMSCRYPGGVSSPRELWELLSSGTDAVSGFPEDRGWDLEGLYDPDPDRRGTCYAREGGFLEDVAGFDAAFFGIGPREALAMDPQQRLLLEASWEAFEDAGIDASSLRGTQTGVFAGVMYHDYASDLWSLPEDLEGYIGTGSSGSVASGRVAYTFGLEGPAVTVDTACSSSLVALHMACGALRQGECSLALAGGVTVLSTPVVFLGFARQRGLAVDGRCKSFADAADGAGFSEGVGLVLLERLSDARRNGHRVLGLVRGSAVNQDGASNGLTAPNGPSQQRVIRQALASASLGPSEVDAVEGHGTGTMLGDPIEAQALLATYGRQRDPGRPLWLGSIKSNIGHAQAAAGVAGVIKMVMALRHGVLPRTLHVDEPSRQVDWSAGAVSLLTEAAPWPRNGRPRRAAVSSFGISGTNAHMILEEAPALERALPRAVPASEEPAIAAPAGEELAGAEPAGAEPAIAEPGGAEPGGGVLGCGVVPWVLSGRGVGGLRGQAGRLGGFVAGDRGVGVEEVGFSLAGRAALEDRAVVLGSGREELLEGVRALARGESAPTVVRAIAPGAGGAVALLFSGQGTQRVGMGRELYEAFPVFAEAFDEACGYLDEHLGCSLREVVLGEPSGGDGLTAAEKSNGKPSGGVLLDETLFTQTGLFALEVALFALVKSLGVHPAFLIGHSIGELVAAHVAGVFTLKDACALVAARGRLMGRLPAGGAMVSVGASEQEALESLAGLEDRVALAAVNGPSAVVLSGEEDAVLKLAEAWDAQGRKTKRLRVSHAFHSPRMDEMLDELLQAARGLSFAPPTTPIISNVTGEPLSTDQVCSPEYWIEHARRPVRFCDGMRWLAAHGVHNFLELGPDAVLSAIGQDCLDDAAENTSEPQQRVLVPALRGERPETQVLLTALSELWVHGVHIDWDTIFTKTSTRIDLPTYAFQRKPYWLKTTHSSTTNITTIGQAPVGHPLLGAVVGVAGGGGWLFTGRLSLGGLPWLGDHVVLGSVLLPGTAFLEVALHAGSVVGAGVVRELVLEAPLVLVGDRGVQLQVAVGEPDERGSRTLNIYSRLEDLDEPDSERWTRHATGILTSDSTATSETHDTHSQFDALNESVWPPEGSERIEVDDLYEEWADAGLEYGQAFQGLRSVWRRGNQVFAEVALSDGERDEAAHFGVHPALYESALHALKVLGVWDKEGERDGVRLPSCWAGVRLHAAGASSLRVCLSPMGADAASLVIADGDGEPVASVESVMTREMAAGLLRDARGDHGDSLFRIGWNALPAAPEGSENGLAVLGAEDSVLVGSLREAEHSVEVYAGLEMLGEAVDEGALGGTVLVDLGAHVIAGVSPGLSEAAREILYRALSLMQAWLSDERFSACRMVFLTEGAVAVGSGDEMPDLTGAPLWGLVRSAQSEHPDRFVLADVDGRDSFGALGAALGTCEPQFALRAGEIYVPRLAPVDLEPSRERFALGHRGTVLITGGLGGLGRLLARHLVIEHGAGHLLLTGRRGLDTDGAPELKAELEGLGAQVAVAACDVANAKQLELLLESVPVEHPLSAVIHAAGAFDNGMIDSLTAERLDRVLTPKLDGALLLHELTERVDLEAFVLFSSMAGVFGGPGQANYAAGNAFLDALAGYRRSRGLVATSMAWPLWADVGAGRYLGELDMRRMAGSASLGTLSTAQGLELFDRALANDDAVVIPVHLDRRVLRAEARSGALPTLLGGLVPMPLRRAGDGGASLARRLAAMPAAERERAVRELVRGHVATVLGHASRSAVPEQRAFKELGFDSLAAVELRNRLNAATGMRLPATLVFDYPTTAALAGYLSSEMAAKEMPAAVLGKAELDRLEEILSSPDLDDSARRQVTARLHVLLSSVTVDGSIADDDLEMATATEVFEIIDKELGLEGASNAG